MKKPGSTGEMASFSCKAVERVPARVDLPVPEGPLTSTTSGSLLLLSCVVGSLDAIVVQMK